MSGTKKPYVGLKFRIPRIGICKIIGIDHDRLFYIVKRGRRKMLVSFGFFRDICLWRSDSIEFTGWTDNVDMSGYVGLSIASFTMRLKDVG